MSCRGIVIGGSAGASEALAVILGALPAEFALPVLVALRLEGEDTGAVARKLASATCLPVVEPFHNEPILPGRVHTAPANYHMLVERDGTIAFSVEEKVNRSRPSIDVLFESAARAWGEGAVAVLLSGESGDGTAGLGAIKAAGGRTMAQDPSTAAHSSMLRTAIDAGAVDEVLRPGAIGVALADCRPEPKDGSPYVQAADQNSTMHVGRTPKIGNRPAILIVDDREANLVELRNMLDEVEADVVEATSGNAALAATLDRDFALAILDVQMPGMDGYELARLLRGDTRARRMPIILITAAHPDETSILTGYESGAVDYLVTPYSPIVLLAKVRVFLELHARTAELAETVRHLAASEERYRTLVTTVPDIVYRLDPDGYFTFLNEAVRSLGYTPEELAGRHFSELLLPADAKRASRAIVLPTFAGKHTGPEGAPRLFDERRTGPRRTLDLEVRVVLRQGRAVEPEAGRGRGEPCAIVEVHSSGLYAEPAAGGSRVFVGSVGVIRDVTDRARAEEELRRHRDELETLVAERTAEVREVMQDAQLAAQRWQTTFDTMHEATAVLDPDMKIVCCNAAMRQLIDRPLEQIVGQPIAEVLGEASLDAMQSRLEHALCDERVTFEIEQPLAGEPRFIQAVCTPVQSVSSAGTGWIVSAGDVTERKRAEHRSRHLNAVLQAQRNVNRLITREEDRQRLIHGACVVLTETLAYPHAWIALTQGPGTICGWAQAAVGAEAEAALSAQLQQGSLPDCAQQALAAGGLVVIRNPAVCPGCRLAGRYAGCGGVAAPLTFNGTTYGVIEVALPAPLLDEAEERALLLEVGSDVAFALRRLELQERHRELERLNEDLARFPSENPNPVLRVLPGGRQLYANAAAAAVFDTLGVARDGSVADLCGEHVSLALAAGQPRRAELKVAESVFDATFAPVRDRGYVNVYLRDITDRTHAVEALARRARLASIFLTVPDDEMFNSVLAEVLDVMRSPFGVFGYLDEDGSLVVPTMTRQVWDQCQVPAKSVRFPRETWGESSWPRAIREKRQIFSNEVSNRTPEGHVTITRHVSLPILFRDEAIGLLQVANREDDYTEGDVQTLETVAGQIAPLLAARLQRERTQEALCRLNESLEERVRERTAELAAVNRELEAFSYSASHDLKAPLRAIDGYARMLEEDYADRLDNEGRRVLGVVRRSVQDMGQLINALLTFSRMSRKNLQPDRVDMRALVEDARRQVLKLADSRRIRWNIGELPPAFADEATIREVWINLLANAVKFTEPREEAVIECGFCDSGSGFRMTDRPSTDAAASSPPDVVYYVRDNGVGFDMAYRDKLFNVFQRLHAADEFEGTGIGLALVQRIIERHGGRIWAEGHVGEGATFWFCLPDKAEE